MSKQICPQCGGTGEVINFKSLAKLRTESGLTLKQVAAKMGISYQYLCDLEHGRRAWNGALFEAFNRVVNAA